jgi:carboxylesterase type B
MGTGAAFDGAILASYTKTIVVTINYRLGPFGKIIVVDLIKVLLFPVYIL